MNIPWSCSLEVAMRFMTWEPLGDRRWLGVRLTPWGPWCLASSFASPELPGNLDFPRNFPQMDFPGSFTIKFLAHWGSFHLFPAVHLVKVPSVCQKLDAVFHTAQLNTMRRWHNKPFLSIFRRNDHRCCCWSCVFVDTVVEAGLVANIHR